MTKIKFHQCRINPESPSQLLQAFTHLAAALQWTDMNDRFAALVPGFPPDAVGQATDASWVYRQVGLANAASGSAFRLGMAPDDQGHVMAMPR